ncbi:MAG: helix-turn-helix domain-containing protein [Cypionkella sp.]
MSKNFIRILKLAESLSDAPRHGFSKPEVVARAGFPPSTVYRLLNDMEQAGFIYTTQDGRILPNFSFERRIGLGTIKPDALRHACALISNTLQSASEIILRRGHNLLWHITDEHPMQPIKLRAHPGYVRGTYELDSISRVALAGCGLDEIERSWDLSAFFDVGVHAPHLPWDKAKERIQAAKLEPMQFDMAGNAKGIRRFAMPIHEPSGELVCILTVAEAATPVRDEGEHVSRIRAVLSRVKGSLEAGVATSRGFDSPAIRSEEPEEEEKTWDSSNAV